MDEEMKNEDLEELAEEAIDDMHEEMGVEHLGDEENKSNDKMVHNPRPKDIKMIDTASSPPILELLETLRIERHYFMKSIKRLDSVIYDLLQNHEIHCEKSDLNDAKMKRLRRW